MTKKLKAPTYIAVVINKENGARRVRKFDEQIETMRDWVNRNAGPDNVITVYAPVHTVTRPNDAVWEDLK